MTYSLRELLMVVTILALAIGSVVAVWEADHQRRLNQGLMEKVKTLEWLVRQKGITVEWE